LSEEETYNSSHTWLHAARHQLSAYHIHACMLDAASLADHRGQI
jgi:hypothetical protein